MRKLITILLTITLAYSFAQTDQTAKTLRLVPVDTTTITQQNGKLFFNHTTGKLRIMYGGSKYTVWPVSATGGGGGSSTWGSITGTLSSQTDLQTALNARLEKTSNLSDVTNATTALSNIGGQPLDGDLTAISALTGTNNIYYRSALNTWSPVTIGSNLSFSGGTLSNTLSATSGTSVLKGDGSGGFSSATASDLHTTFGSQTANTFYAAPNGSAGNPSFRSIVAADIPTLNQNTTGSAGSVANSVTFNNSGSGDASGTTYNGSAARTISHNSIGAQPLDSDLTSWAGVTRGSGFDTWAGTPSWTNFNSLITGTAPFWLTSGTTTLPGAATITNNLANGLNFGGAWTATANNQAHINFGGSPTSRSTDQDNMFGSLFSHSLTSAPTNTQYLYGAGMQHTLISGDANDEMTALLVNPTYSGTNAASRGIVAYTTTASAFTGLKIVNGTNSGSVGIGMVANNGATPSTNSTFTITRGNGANGALTMVNSGSGTFGIQTAATSRLQISGTGLFSFSSDNQTAAGSFFDLTPGTLSSSSGSGIWSILNINTTYNQTGTASQSIYGIRYNPTPTSVLGTHYAAAFSSGLVGIGNLTPTAKLEVVSDNTTTQSIVDFENSALTSRFKILGNGETQFSGSAGTSGQVLTSGGTGAPPTWSTNISGNAANVTGTVAVGNGGTGATTLTGVLIGNGTSAITASAASAGLQYLRRNAGNTAYEWATISGGGDMLSTNNLSDVANAATARNNILPSKTGNSLKVLRVNAGETDYELATISSGSGHTIKEEGTALAARTGLNFVGSGITATDDGGNDETDVALDADLNTIASQSPSNDDFMQYKAGAWANRTVAQVKTDLGLSNTNSGDVALAGTPDYITISGQTITRGLIDLATDVTGTLPIANGGTGQTTANAALNAFLPTQSGQSGKYLTTDGSNTSWGSPAGSGDMILASTQTNTGLKTFNNNTLEVAGSTSGTTKLNASAVAGTTTATFPAYTGEVQVFNKTVLGSDYTNNSTTASEITGLQIGTTGTGLFQFEYNCFVQSAATTTGWKFGVNHTGTATVMSIQMTYGSTGGTAATGVGDDVAAVNTGNIYEHSVATAFSTAGNLGPTAGVAATGTNVWVKVFGVINVTASGDLELYGGSEVASSQITVKANSFGRIWRVN